MPPPDQLTLAGSRARGLAGDGAAFRVRLVGQPSPGGLLTDRMAFLGAPLPRLRFGLAGESRGRGRLLAFASQGPGDGPRARRVGLGVVTSLTLVIGVLCTPPG